MYAILSSFNKNIYEWSLRLLISPIVTHSHRPSFYAFKHFYRLHFNVKHASKNELKLQTECEETGGLTLWSLLRCPEHREHLFFLPGRWVMGTRWEQWQWRACVCFLHCKCPLVCLHTWTAPAFPMPTAPPAGGKESCELLKFCCSGDEGDNGRISPLNVELHNICWIVPIFDPQFVFSVLHVGSDSDRKYGSFTK